MKRCSKDASRITKSLGVIIVGSLLYSPWAFAELEIYEVQPWPIDSPTQLVIWGHGFDDMSQLEIMFGTHPDALTIADPDNLCFDTVGSPAPPLDLDNPANFDCVVAQLAAVPGGEPSVPSGDYLLQLMVGGAAECTDKHRVFPQVITCCSSWLAGLQNAQISPVH